MHPRDSHAGRPDPHGCGSFSSFIEDVLAVSNRSPATTRNQRTALNHLARALGHETPAPLALTDLTSANCSAALADLVAAGMSPANANKQRQVWLTIAKAAKAAGLLTTVPKIPALPQTSRAAVEPWPLGDVERIFASARSLTGTIAEIPADRWWSALLCVLADTALPVADVLAVPKIDYDRRTGTLCSGLLSYQLHPRAVAALDAIRFHPQERLIPWPFDDGKAPFHTLLRRYRELLWRVDLPHVAANLFHRLQLTARKRPTLLADLRLDVVVAIREQPLPDTRKPRSRKETLSNPAKPSRRGRKVAFQERDSAPDVYRIAIESPRTLRAFFDDKYRPQRLADAAEQTVGEYRYLIGLLSDYLCCDPTVDCLSDDVIERYLAWRKQLGRSSATVNKDRRCLLALWRHAWRKRLVADLPRDIFKYSVPKRIPEAWSTAEVARILTAAADTPGSVCGIPAGPWWVALILTLYDTGLRIAALMSARSAWLTADGWLNIPADVQKQDADQSFRLHPDTLAAIQAIDPQSRPLLFPFHALRRRHILRKHYRRILKRAGLACGRRDLFHKLRRTSATAVCDAFDEVAASKHLGHSSLDVTRRYIDPRKLTRKQTAAEVITRPVLGEPS